MKREEMYHSYRFSQNFTKMCLLKEYTSNNCRRHVLTTDVFERSGKNLKKSNNVNKVARRLVNGPTDR